MLNRNKTDLDLARRYRDPDDDDFDEERQRRDLVPWFGLQLKTATIFRVGFGLCGLMVVLVGVRWQFADHIPWLPLDTLWFNIAFLVMVFAMSFISFTMFRAATNMFRQEIREIDARMARRDNSTEEEVAEFVQESEKQLNRKMTKRWAVMLAVLIPLYPVLGTQLIFPWGGLLPFAGAAIVVFALVIIWCYHRRDVFDRALRLFSAPRN